MLSIAFNSESSDRSLFEAFRGRGFFRIKKKIHFIVKALDQREGLQDPGRWQLFRSDIDTW